jgi:cholesterol 24(S)-hydroxylase
MDLSTVLLLFCVVLALAVVAFITLYLAFTFYLLYLHGKYRHIPGPARDSFYFGHILAFSKARKKGKSGLECLEEWSNIHGPVFVFWVMQTPVVTAYSPEMAKRVAVTLNLPKSAIYNKISYVYDERAAGRGILTETDPIAWQRKRAMLNPAFHRRYLMNLMPAFNEICDQFLDRIGSFADKNKQVNMAEEFSRVTLEVIGKVGIDHGILMYIISLIH